MRGVRSAEEGSKVGRRMDSVYDLYRSGCELLDHGDHQAAIVPLTRARKLEPDKASIREALGRALFHAQRYEDAAAEFRAIAAQAPTNDYALFCLGRAMQQLGRHEEARHPLALACSLAPRAPRLPNLPGAFATRGAWRLDGRCYSRPTAFVSAFGRRQSDREWADARSF